MTSLDCILKRPAIAAMTFVLLSAAAQMVFAQSAIAEVPVTLPPEVSKSGTVLVADPWGYNLATTPVVVLRPDAHIEFEFAPAVDDSDARRQRAALRKLKSVTRLRKVDFTHFEALEASQVMELLTANPELECLVLPRETLPVSDALIEAARSSKLTAIQLGGGESVKDVQAYLAIDQIRDLKLGACSGFLAEEAVAKALVAKRKMYRLGLRISNENILKVCLESIRQLECVRLELDVVPSIAGAALAGLSTLIAQEITVRIQWPQGHDRHELDDVIAKQFEELKLPASTRGISICSFPSMTSNSILNLMTRSKLQSLGFVDTHIDTLTSGTLDAIGLLQSLSLVDCKHDIDLQKIVAFKKIQFLTLTLPPQEAHEQVWLRHVLAAESLETLSLQGDIALTADVYKWLRDSPISTIVIAGRLLKTPATQDVNAPSKVKTYSSR